MGKETHERMLCMLFIVNDTACSGRAGAKFDEVQTLLKQKCVAYRVEYTKYRGHAKELAREAAEKGENTVIAVGGDGTVREVACGLAGSEVCMGILPMGTGNDYVKSHKIPEEAEAALDCVLRGHVQNTDACMLNGEYFFNVAGMGFDVDVLVETERYKDKHMPYFRGIISAIAHRKPLFLRITTDGETEEGKYLIVNIANGKYFGGGMKVAPNADPNDGLFDVIIIKYVSLWNFLWLLPTFIKGKHVKHKRFVKVKHARKVIIEHLMKEEYPIQMDGEIDGITPGRFEILHGGLKLITPEVQG